MPAVSKRVVDGRARGELDVTRAPRLVRAGDEVGEVRAIDERDRRPRRGRCVTVGAKAHGRRSTAVVDADRLRRHLEVVVARVAGRHDRHGGEPQDHARTQATRLTGERDGGAWWQTSVRDDGCRPPYTAEPTPGSRLAPWTACAVRSRSTTRDRPARAQPRDAGAAAPARALDAVGRRTPSSISSASRRRRRIPRTPGCGRGSTAFEPEDAVRPASSTDRVVRLALMRGTIHLVTARDAWGLRPLVQPVMDRVQQGQFGKRLVGVDLEEVVAMGRAFVDAEPRTFKALGRPSPDALAGPRPVRARAGGPDGRAAHPGPAPRPVGPEWSRSPTPRSRRGSVRRPPTSR